MRRALHENMTHSRHSEWFWSRPIFDLKPEIRAWQITLNGMNPNVTLMEPIGIRSIFQKRSKLFFFENLKLQNVKFNVIGQHHVKVRFLKTIFNPTITNMKIPKFTFLITWPWKYSCSDQAKRVLDIFPNFNFI